jgi:hypothetical protein
MRPPAKAAITSATVQQPDTAICNTAFSQGIRDNYFVLSENDQFKFYQQRLCSANFTSYQSFRSSATGLGISIPLAEGLLGLSGSDEQNLRSFCNSTKAFAKITSSVARTISAM